MKLRKLKIEDAPKMLEWMHDSSVVEHLQTDFSKKSINDCLRFIENSINEKNINYAIADDNDEYMGTVSLKNIFSDEAEFAITIRKCAMGKGYSIEAMKKIIEYGFNELNLKTIYWCVNPINKRAVRFYDKNHFKRIDPTLIKTMLDGYSLEQIAEYFWYAVTKQDSAYI